MNHADKVAAIDAAAAAFEFTPERHCQVAMANIYKASNCLPYDLPIPHGDHDWARTHGRSLITPWVEQSGFFIEVPIEERAAGDLLGFRLGRMLHHVAIQLSGGRLVHVFGAHGVLIAPCIPTPWLARLEKVWRLK